jgi:amino acid adenylation domain-containing protein
MEKVCKTRTGQVLAPTTKIGDQPSVNGGTVELHMDRVIPRLPRHGPMPMSFAQQRLWFLEQLAPGNPAYNMFEAFHLAGVLQVAALQQALNSVVQRHESLRTVFGDKDGQPFQVVREPGDFPLDFIDLSGAPAEQREERLCALMTEEVARPFNLRQDRMLRAKLLQLAPTEHILLLTLHHIASDGWSIGILMQELAALYNATVEGVATTLPQLPIQYPDFAAWQHQLLENGELREQGAYWKKQLAGAPESLELPADRTRPAVQSFRGGVERIVLSPALGKKLKDLSRAEGVTMFMTLLAGFNTLLHRVTRQTDIIVGTPIAGRNHFQTQELIGFFINTLAIRTDLTKNPTFRTLLRRVRETTLDAFANQDFPFDKLVAELQPERSSSRPPIFQVLFAVQSGLASSVELKGLTLSRRPVQNGTAKFDLTLMMTEGQEGLMADLEYNRDLFEPGTIAGLLRQFQLLLQGIADNPDRPISDQPLLSAAEREKVLVEWNRTARDYPADQTVFALFEQQARLHPKAIAVQADQHSLTYAELNARANQIANELQAQGVRPEECVGIYLERGLEMIVTMLGILKAGAAYLPLDPSYPKERIRFMLQDAGVRLMFSVKELAEHLPANRARVIRLDTEARRLKGRSTGNPLCSASGDSLAYVIYTSGSTGQPKGARIRHRAISRLVLNTDYVELGPNDNIAQVSNCSFDAATFEIWGALLNGGQVTILPNDLLLSPPLFARALEKHGITTLFITTSLFNLFAREMPNAFRTLRQLLFGGEAADPLCCAEILKAGPPAKLMNVYGPTETTTFATFYPLLHAPEAGKAIPIGRPIANTTAYILDEYMQPVPPGVPGELYIGGDGVGLGYLNRAELTRQKFVANPFGAGTLYRTGDLARFLPDGNIDFLGRIDSQVKIRGFRVELGEIETVLSRHPAVKQTAVTVREDIPTQKMLVAYFVAAEKQEASPEALMQYLKEQLPDYMVPSFCVKLAALPLNPNGKIDRRALPKPAAPAVSGGTHEEARDPLERQLVEIWEEVLQRAPIGVKDNFFQLGGHSLLAVQLALKLEKVLGKRIVVSTLFQAPTVEQLARVLRHGQERSTSAIVEVQGRGSKPPIFLVHGVGGGMFWGYRNLSRYLGDDQPVYVLRSRAMDGREEEFDRLEEMAAQYVSELRQFQPEGALLPWRILLRRQCRLRNGPPTHRPGPVCGHPGVDELRPAQFQLRARALVGGLCPQIPEKSEPARPQCHALETRTAPRVSAMEGASVEAKTLAPRRFPQSPRPR